MIKTLNSVNIRHEVRASRLPLIVAFVRRRDNYAQYFNTLHSMDKAYMNKVAFAVFDEDYIKLAFDEFEFIDTPTFLAFRGGEEVGRTGGSLDRRAIEQFIIDSLGIARVTGLKG